MATVSRLFSNGSLAISGELDEVSNPVESFKQYSNGSLLVKGIFDEVEKLYAGSISFDGDGDYLTLPGNTVFQADSAFSAECWIYPTNTAEHYGIIGYHKIAQGTNTGGWVLNLRSSGTEGVDPAKYLAFNTYNTTAATLLNNFNSVTNAEITINTWTHVAISYDNTTYRMFVNGNLVSNVASIGNVSYSNATFNIGRWDYVPSRRYFPGYITDIRFVKGNALYTSNFTPPQRRLTAAANTELLIAPTAGNATISDTSTSNRTISTFGNVAVSNVIPTLSLETQMKKYSNGTVLINGEFNEVSLGGQDLKVVYARPSTAYSSNYTFGPSTNQNTFTFSLWMKGTDTLDNQVFFGRDTNKFFRFDNWGGTGTNFANFSTHLTWGNGVVAGGRSTAYNPSLTTWAHITCGANNGTPFMYINGVQQTTIKSVSNSSPVQLIINGVNSYFGATDSVGSRRMLRTVAEFYFLDGKAYDYTYFTHYDYVSGKTYPLNYKLLSGPSTVGFEDIANTALQPADFGNNGFYMKFLGNFSDSSTLGHNFYGNTFTAELYSNTIFF